MRRMSPLLVCVMKNTTQMRPQIRTLYPVIIVVMRWDSLQWAHAPCCCCCSENRLRLSDFLHTGALPWWRLRRVSNVKFAIKFIHPSGNILLGDRKVEKIDAIPLLVPWMQDYFPLFEHLYE